MFGFRKGGDERLVGWRSLELGWQGEREGPNLIIIIIIKVEKDPLSSLPSSSFV
jgi:hypothetical protein